MTGQEKQDGDVAKMGAKQPEHIFTHFRADFLASIVVFLVALPLCIGIAVAVGVPPSRALMTGIVGGILVGVFAGSPLQVSGPAAGLFVIVADLIRKAQVQYAERNEGATDDESFQYALAILGLCVFLAGLIQIVAGQLKLGQWFRAVSPAVIKGMLAGIGILILVSQFHVMLDHKAIWHDGEKAHGALQYIALIPEAVGKCFSADTDANHHLAAFIGIVSISIFLFWPKLAPQKIKFLPAALIGILVASILAAGAQLGVHLLEIPKNMLTDVTLPSLNWMQMITEPMVITGAFVIALIASAETLLCATAVDQMHRGPRTKYDRELMAQGVGNSVCGVLGALPMTGVIVRSSANVTSGAKTRISTILHGFWLLIFIAAVPFILEFIPRSALGALLVYTGFKLVNIKEIRKLWATSKGEALIYFVTVITIVCTDLLIGVLVGIALSAVKLLIRFSDIKIQLIKKPEENRADLILEGAATFIGLPKLAGVLEDVPEGAELHVDFEHLNYIDHACLDLLMNWADQHAGLGGQLVLDWNKLHGRFSAEGMKKDESNTVADSDAAAAKMEAAKNGASSNSSDELTGSN